MTNRTPLSEDEVTTFLATHPHWSVENDALVRTFEAPAFLRGVEFVARVAKIAEVADHHPDIDIRWRKVTLRFITHDAGNKISGNDTRLADECDLIFSTL